MPHMSKVRSLVVCALALAMAVPSAVVTGRTSPSDNPPPVTSKPDTTEAGGPSNPKQPLRSEGLSNEQGAESAWEEANLAAERDLAFYSRRLAGDPSVNFTM